MASQTEAEQLKEKGNEAFKNDDWDTAVELYSKAIRLAGAESRELATYLKNRAAAYLKRQDYELAVRDCDASLQISAADPKTLWRRCQALEQLERFEEAYRDARQVLAAEPANRAVQSALERLHTRVQERARQLAQTTSKVEGMHKVAFDASAPAERRETAMNNLLVLARSAAGAEAVLRFGVVHQVQRLLRAERGGPLCVAAVRIVGELCKGSAERTLHVVRDVGLPWFLDALDSDLEAQVSAASYCMQAVLNALSGMDNRPDSRPDSELSARHAADIDALLACLVASVDDRLLSGRARDTIIELITRNVHHTQLAWAERLVQVGGVQRLLAVASELPELQHESSMATTSSSRTVAGVCLARVYDNMYYDGARASFMAAVDGFVRDQLLAPDTESKVRVAAALTTLLRGPLDVGNAVVARDGIIEMLLVMAGADDALQQRVACECLVAAASKQDKAKAILAQGVDILKRLYRSPDAAIRVRALVGLCKLGSSGGSDASIKPFADGSTLKLAEACRRFLVQPGADADLRRWAAEGLSYLTLDAEVKERLVDDAVALRALVELARSGDQSALYGVVTTLVNLCNAYDKQELAPEMVELAKFAKHHIPEEHEFDDPDFVSRRVCALGGAGVASALVALSRTESDSSRELIARVFNALCGEQELRGLVVSQGGCRALLTLAAQGTVRGRRLAAQALARIAITTDPEFAFPGQRLLEIVKPLVGLLHEDCSGLENFEALMALCNVAQTGEAARLRLVKEGGVARVDNYMYEEHVMLRRAATQVITNMSMSPDVVRMYEGDNDRAKFLLMLCGEEDADTALAAAGALAILTEASVACCTKLFDCGSWLDYLHLLLANEDAALQLRGVYIVRNLIQASKDIAQRLIDTDIMEILMALSRVDSGDVPKLQVKQMADEALKHAESWHLIAKPPSAPAAEPAIQDDD